MSFSLFKVIKHTCPCQHIREYPQATKDTQETRLQLAIKQYIPLDNLEPNPGDVTIITTHGNGFPKEAYEPLWNDLLTYSKSCGFQIRSIWAADMSHQGASGVLNERLQGDDPSWFDHARDLLTMINQFRDQMPRPIVGIGHSMGTAQLVQLSIMHPRLFTTLILTEPVIQRAAPPGPNSAMMSTFRRDIWPSFDKAAGDLRGSKVLASLDRRVIDKLVQYSYRAIPTALYSISETAHPGSVTLTTTKHQETWTYMRPNFRPQGAQDDVTAGFNVERLLSPDLDLEIEGKYLFHRAEPGIAVAYLPFVRPSVLWVFGGESATSTSTLQNEKMEKTGTGLGGSGGAKVGRVAKVVFPDQGHLLPFVDLAGCATVMGDWLKDQLGLFRKQEDFLQNHDREKSDQSMLRVSQKWTQLVRETSTALRPAEKL